MYIAIGNPKRHASPPFDERIFPYYAGFSTAFAEQLLSSFPIGLNTQVLDPWNGSGTTTQIATRLGIQSIGLDLNPTMVVVAKAALLPPQESASLLPLALSLIERSTNGLSEMPDDPLCIWLAPESALFVRQLENEINKTLINHGEYCPLWTTDSLNHISALGAFYYVAIFRAVRRILAAFIPSNPTWIKRPKAPQERKRPSRETVNMAFLNEVQHMINTIVATRSHPTNETWRANISLGDSVALPLSDSTIDYVVTSPPYCTRIDYAIATSIELAVLRFDNDLHDRLRRSLMGTSTVSKTAVRMDPAWGDTCLEFLEAVCNHPSKASKTYYFKNHLQYFASLFASVSEISRVLKTGATCVLVVQDSFYKDVHNDLPAISTEMAHSVGLSIKRREDFPANRSMVGLNQRARAHLSTRCNVESVLCFERTKGHFNG